MSLAELSNVNKTYPGSDADVPALQDVSLVLDAGEFVAIEGPSGCGKSTLLLTLGGLLRPDTGRVQVGQQNVYQLPAEARARFRSSTVGFVFQQFYLVPYLSVRDNVLAASLGAADSKSNTAARADTLLEQFGLAGRRNHRPGRISTGERQRTALARAMFNQPRLILADEPTGNLDHASADVVLDHLAQFTDSGGAVLLVTHDSRAAERTGRRLRMVGGQLVEL